MPLPGDMFCKGFLNWLKNNQVLVVCAAPIDQSLYDIKVPRERFERMKPSALLASFRGTLMSYNVLGNIEILCITCPREVAHLDTLTYAVGVFLNRIFNEENDSELTNIVVWG